MRENPVNINDSGSILIPKINLGGGTEKVTSENIDTSKVDHAQDKLPEKKNVKKILENIFYTTKKENKKEDMIVKKNKKLWKYVRIAILVLLVFTVITGILAYNVYKKALVVRSSLINLEASAKEQDLEKIKQSLSVVKEDLSDFDNSYKTLSFLKIIPRLGAYYSDGQHSLKAADHGIDAAGIVIDAFEPYADIIGFKTAAKKEVAGGQTAQERIDFIVKTAPDLIPKADSLSGKASLIKVEVDQIDPEIYPEKFAGREVRSKIKSVVELVDQAEIMIKNSKPLLEASPYLMGVDGVRTYMVLFQNDKELRPTGGFLTAYSIAKVDKGRFEPVSSSDIYQLDGTYKPKIAAPAAFPKYLKGIYVGNNKFRIRDMNWSPDFEESMNMFTKESEGVGIKGIDGIIAVDTQVLVNILNVIGPVDVPGFGKFSNEIVPECKCPQVIYELESFADQEGAVVWSENEPGKIVFAPPNYGTNRKRIIGPLMNSVLANTLGQPKEKMPMLFESVISSLTEKHIIFYMFDDKTQKALTDFGIAGTISDYDGDYLHINDANLGGRKSNLYATQEVSQEVEIGKDGSITKTVVITYKNPEKQDGWLNSVLPNWVRVYVPKGSELISFEGVKDKEDPYEELDKTVFAGGFELRPQGVSKVTLKYKLPFKSTDEYRLLVQKQPGKGQFLYTLKVGKRTEEVILSTDREFKYKL